MGLADVVEEAQEPYAAVYSPESLAEAQKRAAKLADAAKRELKLQGFKDDDICTETLLNLRYEGTDTAMMIREPEDGSGDFAAGFLKQFRQEYGFELLRKAILISDVRVHATGITNILQPVVLEKANDHPQAEGRKHEVYFTSGWHSTSVYMLENLLWGHTMPGPAVIMNGNSTILVEPDCKATITKYGNVHIEIAAAQSLETQAKKSMVKADVIQLSIFNNRYVPACLCLVFFSFHTIMGM
jgi:5-oxoprolinase (ATP-hydrolysing)